ncbi:hypothetical protein SK571_21825 [Lentzea sp. BCCO 10_0798]|uniref:SH3 domain-containing protein n=1 Tax=Lentzea kristufekii TaxID=3095430 RepID=A0ABU4TUS9_9PSEU|nr:hypothetical protein [Lentzea sp. BCCO 10_0798]MDX8052040.1 hypothetical protein [Lentzea sp. BCCO 10_0798]
MSAPAAQAAAGCYQSGGHAGYGTTYTCNIWRTNHPWAMYGPGRITPIGNVEGVLNAGNSWFVCQKRFGIKLEYGSIKNDWFAYTLGDNGYWGWVSATHFSAGGNWEAVPGLAHCPGGFGDTAAYPGERPVPHTWQVPGPDRESKVFIN